MNTRVNRNWNRRNRAYQFITEEPCWCRIMMIYSHDMTTIVHKNIHYSSSVSSGNNLSDNLAILQMTGEYQILILFCPIPFSRTRRKSLDNRSTLMEHKSPRCTCPVMSTIDKESLFVRLSVHKCHVITYRNMCRSHVARRV